MTSVLARPWVDLEPYWLGACRAASRRDEQKRAYASSRYWNDQSHLVGLLGEIVYGASIGRLPDYTLRVAGDAGADFPGVDVKTSRYWLDPWLKVPVGELSADLYVLVALDMPAHRGYVAGTATADDVRRAEQHDWGHGPMWSISGTSLG